MSICDTIGSAIREMRKERGLSQGDIEKSSGLLRCYLSRVENGYTVPNLSTLESISTALSIKPEQLIERAGVKAAEGEQGVIHE